MATETPLFIDTLIAGEDLSSKQYYFVVFNADGEVVAPSAITDLVIGILQNKPTEGEAAEVMIWGRSKVSADAAFDEGALLGTSTDGQAQTAVNTNYVAARAIQAATKADQLVSVYVFPATCVIHA